MSHFAQVARINLFRGAHPPVDRRGSDLDVARGIINGVVIGAITWVAIIAVGYVVVAMYAVSLGH